MQTSNNNRKWIRRSIIASLLIFVGFIGGMIFSWNFYGSLMMFGTDVPNGSIAVINLKHLEANEPEGVKLDLEWEVDRSLATYSYSSEKWWFPIYESGWLIFFDPNEVDNLLKKVATYRKNHPSPSRDAFKDMTEEWWQNPENQELAEFDKDYRRRIDEMVKKYAE